MPTITTIEEVSSMDDKDPIKCIKGTLVKLWPANKSGPDDADKWSFQTGTLRANGKEIKVVFKDRDELPEKKWRGKMIVISARKGDKGYTGCRKETDSYKGRNEPQVWVTASADVQIVEDDNSGSEEQGEDHLERREERELKREKTSTPKEQVKAPTASTSDFKTAKGEIVRFANLHSVCVRAVRNEFKTLTEDEIPASPELINATIAAVYIAAERRNLHAAMPATPLKSAFAVEEERKEKELQEELERGSEAARKSSKADDDDDNVPM